MQGKSADPIVCVAGAGSIGLMLAGRLMIGGARVRLVARQASVDFIRQYGLRLVDTDGTHHLRPETGVASHFSAADILFLCSKSYDLAELAVSVRHLISADTLVVPIVNGVPWWYFDGRNDAWDGQPILAVDPENRLKTVISSRQVIGTTTMVTAERLDRGTVRIMNGLQMTIGELDDRVTPRLAELGLLLERSGFRVDIVPRIRDAVWNKVAKNLISNPLTAITGASLGTVFSEPVLAKVSRQMLHEVTPLIEAHGARLDIDEQSIFLQGAKLGAFKTSMLQDIERGRPLELAAICDAVLELAAGHGIAMPVVEAVRNIAHYCSERPDEGVLLPAQSARPATAEVVKGDFSRRQ